MPMTKRIIQTLAVTLTLLLAGFTAAAQGRAVTGKVLDAQGFPIPGDNNAYGRGKLYLSPFPAGMDRIN